MKKSVNKELVEQFEIDNVEIQQPSRIQNGIAVALVGVGCIAFLTGLVMAFKTMDIGLYKYILGSLTGLLTMVVGFYFYSKNPRQKKG